MPQPTLLYLLRKRYSLLNLPQSFLWRLSARCRSLHPLQLRNLRLLQRLLLPQLPLSSPRRWWRSRNAPLRQSRRHLLLNQSLRLLWRNRLRLLFRRKLLRLQHRKPPWHRLRQSFLRSLPQRLQHLPRLSRSPHLHPGGWIWLLPTAVL